MGNEITVAVPTSPVSTAFSWRDSVASIVATGKYLADKQKELASPHKFRLFVRSELLLDVSAAQKLIAIASHPIIADPANTEKLPAQWVKLYNLSRLSDDKLKEFIEDGTAITITKNHLRKVLYGRGKEVLYGVEKPLSKNGHQVAYPNLLGGSNRIKGVPEGMSLTDHVRSGMELEGKLSATEIPKLLGMGRLSYITIKKAILLSERTDLNQEDTELVRLAIEDVNKTRQIVNLEAINSIAEKVWGGKRGNQALSRQGSREDHKRTAAFDKALVIISDTCQSASDIAIPFLSAQQRALAIDKLIEARAQLLKLARLIQRSQDNDHS